jgi:hypothetical protein
MMARRDVEADILGRLNAFVEAGGRIPSTVDGKVNVVGLCRELRLPPSDAQHFHKKDTIKSAVNGLAAEQDLLVIGARAESTDPAEEKLEDRIRTAHGRAREDAMAAEEAHAGMAALVEELRAAQAQIAALQVQNRVLEERLRLIEERGLFFDAGSW